MRCSVVFLGLGLPVLTAAGTISAVPYATAFANGWSTLFVNGGTSPRADTVTTFNFTGVQYYSGGSSELAAGCAGGPGNGANGCPGSRNVSPGEVYTYPSNSTSASKTLSDGQFTATGSSSAYGMNDSASLNVNRGTGSSTEAEYISAFSISTTPFTVSAPGQNGNSGFLVLTYTIQAPTVSGTSADPSSIIYFGEWTFREWMPTGNTATSHYQNDGIDFATQSGVVQKTYVIPITLGSTLNVAVAEQLGIGWSANTTGATSASGFVDPFSSLTSVIVEDGNSNHISNFLVTDDQGDSFGANGLITPEPSSISLAVLGLLVLSVCAYRLSLRRVAIIETAGPPTPQ